MIISIKKILQAFGMGLVYTFALFVLVSLAPAIIIMITCFWLAERYAQLWSKLRHDPIVRLGSHAIDSEDWMNDDSKEAYIKAFIDISNLIAKATDASKSELQYKGFEVFEQTSKDIDSSTLRLSQMLTTRHAVLELSFEFYASIRDNGSNITLYLDDDGCCAPFPPLEVHIKQPRLRLERSFTLDTDNDVWLAISFLRGNVRFAKTSRQRWAYISEHDVWLVRYKADNSDYGFRLDFTQLRAHKYGFDS